MQAAQALPLTSLHQFLKFNGTPEIKREFNEEGMIETVSIANPDDHVGRVFLSFHPFLFLFSIVLL